MEVNTSIRGDRCDLDRTEVPAAASNDRRPRSSRSSRRPHRCSSGTGWVPSRPICSPRSRASACARSIDTSRTSTPWWPSSPSAWRPDETVPSMRSVTCRRRARGTSCGWRMSTRSSALVRSTPGALVVLAAMRDDPDLRAIDDVANRRYIAGISAALRARRPMLAVARADAGRDGVDALDGGRARRGLRRRRLDGSGADRCPEADCTSACWPTYWRGTDP